MQYELPDSASAPRGRMTDLEEEHSVARSSPRNLQMFGCDNQSLTPRSSQTQELFQLYRDLSPQQGSSPPSAHYALSSTRSTASQQISCPKSSSGGRRDESNIAEARPAQSLTGDSSHCESYPSVHASLRKVALSSQESPSTTADLRRDSDRISSGGLSKSIQTTSLNDDMGVIHRHTLRPQKHINAFVASMIPSVESSDVSFRYTDSLSDIAPAFHALSPANAKSQLQQSIDYFESNPTSEHLTQLDDIVHEHSTGINDDLPNHTLPSMKEHTAERFLAGQRVCHSVTIAPPNDDVDLGERLRMAASFRLDQCNGSMRRIERRWSTGILDAKAYHPPLYHLKVSQYTNQSLDSEIPGLSDASSSCTSPSNEFGPPQGHEVCEMTRLAAEPDLDWLRYVKLTTRGGGAGQGHQATAAGAKRHSQNATQSRASRSANYYDDQGEQFKDSSDDDDAERRRQPPSKGSRIESNDIEEYQGLLLCPFHAYEPKRYSERNMTEMNYRVCSSVYITDIAKLKQHLYRVHKRPDYYCWHCYEVFKDREVQHNHFKDRSCLSSPSPDPKYAEMMTDEQVQDLKKRNLGISEKQKWEKIFRTLFPGAKVPLSPYVDVSGSRRLRGFQDHLCAVLPHKIQLLLRAEGIQFPVHLTTALSETISQIVADYREGQMSLTYTSPPQLTPSTLLFENDQGAGTDRDPMGQIQTSDAYKPMTEQLVIADNSPRPSIGCGGREFVPKHRFEASPGARGPLTPQIANTMLPYSADTYYSSFATPPRKSPDQGAPHTRTWNSQASVYLNEPPSPASRPRGDRRILEPDTPCQMVSTQSLGMPAFDFEKPPHQKEPNIFDFFLGPTLCPDINQNGFENEDFGG